MEKLSVSIRFELENLSAHHCLCPNVLLWHSWGRACKGRNQNEKLVFGAQIYLIMTVPLKDRGEKISEGTNFTCPWVRTFFLVWPINSEPGKINSLYQAGFTFQNLFHESKENNRLFISFCLVRPKIQQTKMLVTCQRFGLIWQYSSNHKTYT